MSRRGLPLLPMLAAIVASACGGSGGSTGAAGRDGGASDALTTGTGGRGGAAGTANGGAAGAAKGGVTGTPGTGAAGSGGGAGTAGTGGASAGGGGRSDLDGGPDATSGGTGGVDAATDDRAEDGPGDAGLDGSDASGPMDAQLSDAPDPTCTSTDGETPTVRLIAPLSTSIVTKSRPTLRWVTNATTCIGVDVCKDRACTIRVGAVAIAGTSAVPAADLAPGIVFWRVRIRNGAGEIVSPTWEFWVGPNNTPTDSTTGLILDVNGDGFADVVVTSYAGTHLYLGGPNGPRSTSIVVPEQWAPTPAGDVNGDGYGDLAVGDVDWFNARGRARVYLGGPDGLRPDDPTRVCTLIGIDDVLARFSASISGAGDVDGDGYGDLAVGEEITNRPGGARYLYLGGLDGVMDYRVQRLVNDQEAGAYRYVVAGVGDVNGDGFTDVLIGEPIATIPGQKNGLVRLYFGGPQGLQPDMPNALQTINSPDDASSYFGGTVYGAGDVNGDGFADVVITSFGIQGATSRMRVYMGGTNGLQAPVMIDGTPGTSFFRPVGTGDINGDGYSDVFVGENTTVRNYRLGPTLRMYFGGPNGLQHVSDGMAAMFVGAGALDECFGCAVASGGDVDGDGYGEMIVSDGGATVNGYENVGQVFVFRGGPAGPTRLARYALIGDPQAGDGFSRFVH